MNITLLCQKTRTRSLRSALLWHLGLAGVLALLGFGVGLLLQPARTESGKRFRMPAGQLQADARTLVAAVRYLLATESDIQIAPAAISGSAADLTIQAPVRPFDTFAYLSNQTEM